MEEGSDPRLLVPAAHRKNNSGRKDAIHGEKSPERCGQGKACWVR